MALINQNSIIGITSITSPSASNVLTVHTNDTTERLRVSTSGLSFSGTNASLDTSGNISAVDGTFTGNVSIGGTLTYEDVTNIDAVGLVTARSGVSITGGDLTLPDAIVHSGDTNTKIRFPAADTFTVETASIERLRINSYGTLGVGCVPNDIQDNFDALQIGGNLILNVDSTGVGAGVYMSNNVYRDRTNSRWEYINTDESTQYLQANGEHIWRYAASGSADSAITWSEALRITSAGSVGTGGLIPSSGNLVVNSTIRSQNASNHISYIGFTQYTGNTTVGSMFSYMGGDGRSSGYLNFSTNNAERLRINANGSIRLTPEGSTANPNARIDTSGDNLRLLTMKDGSGGCGFIIETQHSGSVAEKLRITSDGKIGLQGNTTPVAKLHIGTENNGALSAQTLFVEGAKTGFANYTGLPQNQLCVYDNTASTAGSGGAISFGANCGSSQQTWIAAINSVRESSSNDASNYAGGLAFWTRPAQSTPLERMRVTNNGLTFNGDTAAANALSDYEEGTWTPQVVTGTVSAYKGKYTKVGRLVTISGYVNNFSDRTSGNVLRITNLPFTLGDSQDSCVGSFFGRYIVKSYYSIYAASNSLYFYGMVNTDYNYLEHDDLSHSNSTIYFTATYQSDQ